jgi:hypothetical protein
MNDINALKCSLSAAGSKIGLLKLKSVHVKV